MADERARLVREELSLSTTRFQQQIATLVMLLRRCTPRNSERKKLEHLREQKRRTHQQQQEQVQQRDQGPSQDDGEKGYA